MAPECTKIAHRRSLAIFAADSGIAGDSAVGIKFVPFNHRENRRSLAIVFAEEIAHLGALKIARFCGGAVKIAAATAENRAILVHSGWHRSSASACTWVKTGRFGIFSCFVSQHLEDTVSRCFAY